MSATPASMHEGQILYGKFCWYCHGVIAVAGAREQWGMPSFKDALNRDQARAIQAYVLSRAASPVKP